MFCFSSHLTLGNKRKESKDEKRMCKCGTEGGRGVGFLIRCGIDKRVPLSFLLHSADMLYVWVGVWVMAAYI